jgi:hypothetical protein
MPSSLRRDFAVAGGGMLVAVFAIGPALINKQVRNLGTLLTRAEEALHTEATWAETA